MKNEIDSLPADAAAFARQLQKAAQAGRPIPLLETLRLKRILKEHFPLQQAFRLYRSLLWLGPSVILRQQRLKGAAGLAEARAGAMHVLHAGGARVELKPARLVGNAEAHVIRGTTRTVFVAAFAGATAFSRTSTIRLADGDFLFDIEERERDAMPVDSAFDPVVFHREGETVYCLDDKRAVTRLAVPEALSLLGMDTVSFGHFMGEEFVKFLNARRFEEIRGVPILIDAGMPAQHRQAIAAFTGPDHPIIEVPRNVRVEAERLWVANTWVYSPKILTTDVGLDVGILAYPYRDAAPIIRAAFDELEGRVGGDGGGQGDRLYVSRDPERHRAIRNHTEVGATLAARGYREFRPETLSFVEQFRAYRAASRIVAQTGSAMAGLIMCRPGTKVCLLSHPAMPLNAIWSQFLEEIGIEVTVLVGDFDDVNQVYMDKSGYSIDDANLRAVLDEQLKAA